MNIVTCHHSGVDISRHMSQFKGGYCYNVTCRQSGVDIGRHMSCHHSGVDIVTCHNLGVNIGRHMAQFKGGYCHMSTLRGRYCPHVNTQGFLLSDVISNGA